MGRNALVQQELFYKTKLSTVSNERQQCIRCKEIKPLNLFRKGSGGDKYRVCKSCVNLWVDQLNKLKKITPKPAKDHKCPICLSDVKKHDGSNNTWCLDHNHDTGKARGWLCNKCNSALGFLNDSVHYLKRALQYLEKYDDNS
tara:strand:- start:1494 stop:1922 length:429 start_codon:yes stop_codon:yes gene_type:complete